MSSLFEGTPQHTKVMIISGIALLSGHSRRWLYRVPYIWTKIKVNVPILLYGKQSCGRDVDLFSLHFYYSSQVIAYYLCSSKNGYRCMCADLYVLRHLRLLRTKPTSAQIALLQFNHKTKQIQPRRWTTNRTACELVVVSVLSSHFSFLWLSTHKAQAICIYSSRISSVYIERMR